MASPSLPPWIILRKLLSVCGDLDAVSFSFSPNSASRLSHFTIPAKRQITAKPRVLSADLSAGLFLIHSNGYAVLSTVSRAVDPVPRRVVDVGDDPAILGVISCRGRSMVVGLEYKPSSPRALLHYYFPGATSRWATKGVRNPLHPPGLTGSFISKDVIAHDGRLWWVSDSCTAASSGLLSCDPSADNPQLVFSAGSDLLGYCHHGPCDGIPSVDRRCVQVADGKLRWVQILCEHKEGSSSLPCGTSLPAVAMLTLDHPKAQWRQIEDHNIMSFADVWNDDSYKRTLLPRKEPAPVLIHPEDPSIVYFSIYGYLFCINMITKKVVGEVHCHSPPMLYADISSSSSPLLACMMPRDAVLRSWLLKAAAPQAVKKGFIARWVSPVMEVLTSSMCLKHSTAEDGLMMKLKRTLEIQKLKRERKILEVKKKGVERKLNCLNSQQQKLEKVGESNASFELRQIDKQIQFSTKTHQAYDRKIAELNISELQSQDT